MINNDSFNIILSEKNPFINKGRAKLKIFLILLTFILSIVSCNNTEDPYADVINTPPHYNSQHNLPFELYLGDFNGDHVSDFMQIAGNNVYMFKTNFEKTPILTARLDKQVRRAVAGDFLGKGEDQTAFLMDDYSLMFYAASPDKKEFWWAFTQGDFIAEKDVIVGDYNGDGKDEILVYNRSNGSMAFYSIKPEGFFFEPMPDYEPGNLPDNYSNCRVRAGDFNGDGRDDIILVSEAGQFFYYDSAYQNGKTTFWWAFTSRPDILKNNEEVSVARIDNDPKDDLAFHNKYTGEIRFAKPEYNDGYLNFFSYINKGQIAISANSELFWGSFKENIDEKGSNTRHDALVYEKDTRMIKRADARWDGKIYTYWWAYDQNATTRVDLRCAIARKGIVIKNQVVGGIDRGMCNLFALTFLLEYQITGILGSSYNDLSEEYLLHNANILEGGQRSGNMWWQFIMEGYNRYGIVTENTVPYQANYNYDIINSMVTETVHAQGRHLVYFQPKIFWIATVPDFTDLNYNIPTTFIDPPTATVMSDDAFNIIIHYISQGMPVALGAPHTRAAVGYEFNPSYDGGGIIIIRDSYGLGSGDLGYQTEDFATVIIRNYSLGVFD